MNHSKENSGSLPLHENSASPAIDKRARVESWHGHEIIDPYAWLEGQVQDWDREQSERTVSYLDLPYREEIREGLKKWSNIEQVKTPFLRGTKLFQWRRNAGENGFVLYRGNDLQNQEVVLDPSTINQDGPVGIDWSFVTRDGKYVTYGISEGGSERSVLRIRNVDTKKELPDVIPNTQYSIVSWLPDNSGFYYTRYPEPGTVPAGEENYDCKVFFHTLGDDWQEDTLIFAPNDPHNDLPALTLSEDGKWATLKIEHGVESSDIYVAKVEDPASPDFKPLAVGDEGNFFVTEFDGYFYIRTDYQASKFRVMRISCEAEDVSDKSQWEEFIPEQEEETLENFQIIGGKAVLGYQVKACSKMEIMDLDSKTREEVPLPTLGTVKFKEIEGEENQPELHYSFESYAVPDSIYKLDVQTGKQEKVDGLQVDVDLSGIVTEQITYNSKDGTPVTMFIVKGKEAQNNRDNKTILYGYGGFNVNELPKFSGEIVDWVNSGGVYATANLRGGGEYGKEWHMGGVLEKKQNVIDDFIGASEYLIDTNITQPRRLAIWGGSNGGLLVGAAMVQRPELFGAVICQVPILDMIHYPQLKLAQYWMSELGDPSNPDHFPFLYAYSPYHNVVDGIEYPATFFQTAKNDNRVDPMHARKMTARVQEATASDKPVLLYVQDNAGHGHGLPADIKLENNTNFYTFLRSTLGE